MRTVISAKRLRFIRTKDFHRSETGGSLIEVVVAMIILMIGLLGLVASMAWGLSMSKRLRFMTDTKLTITSMLEQMETLRNTKRLTFGQIANVGQVNNAGAKQPFAGFPTGFQPVSTNPGPDGIYGTDDDLIDPGGNGTYGNNDDFINPALARPLFTRQIAISSLGTNLKRIEVTMRYPGRNGEVQELIGVSYLNNDASSNFR